MRCRMKYKKRVSCCTSTLLGRRRTSDIHLQQMSLQPSHPLFQPLPQHTHLTLKRRSLRQTSSDHALSGKRRNRYRSLLSLHPTLYAEVPTSLSVPDRGDVIEGGETGEMGDSGVASPVELLDEGWEGEVGGGGGFEAEGEEGGGDEGREESRGLIGV
jgi:hypothetical protein